jgi:hypothetical protein
MCVNLAGTNRGTCRDRFHGKQQVMHGCDTDGLSRFDIRRRVGVPDFAMNKDFALRAELSLRDTDFPD